MLLCCCVVVLRVVLLFVLCCFVCVFVSLFEKRVNQSVQGGHRHSSHDLLSHLRPYALLLLLLLLLLFVLCSVAVVACAVLCCLWCVMCCLVLLFVFCVGAIWSVDCSFCFVLRSYVSVCICVCVCACMYACCPCVFVCVCVCCCTCLYIATDCAAAKHQLSRTNARGLIHVKLQYLIGGEGELAKYFRSIVRALAPRPVSKGCLASF